MFGGSGSNINGRDSPDSHSTSFSDHNGPDSHSFSCVENCNYALPEVSGSLSSIKNIATTEPFPVELRGANPVVISSGELENKIQRAPYRPTRETENINCRKMNTEELLFSISAMAEYCNKSVEELRAEDYAARRKINSGTSELDGSCTGTSIVKYCTTVNTEFLRGIERATGTQDVYIISISAMEQYGNLSVEEIRAQDYAAGRKPGSAEFFSIAPIEMYSALSVEPLGFPGTNYTQIDPQFGVDVKPVNNVRHGTAHIAYHPTINPEDLDFLMSISAMNEYRNKSVEELRAEDYEVLDDL